MFCTGCRLRPLCDIHSKPKQHPRVQRFLASMGTAKETGQPFSDGSVADLPMSQWRMVQTYRAVRSRCEAERLKRMSRHVGS